MEDLNTLKKIKEMINWCKSNKVKKFKYGDMEFELSELSMIEGIDDMGIKPIEQAEIAQETTEEANLEDIQDAKEEEDLLFWSSNS